MRHLAPAPSLPAARELSSITHSEARWLLCKPWDERGSGGRGQQAVPTSSRLSERRVNTQERDGVRAAAGAHQNAGGCCEHVLRATLPVLFDQLGPAPHGAALSSSGPSCPRPSCTSIKATQATISPVTISKLAAKVSLFTPAQTESRGFPRHPVALQAQARGGRG